jgi:hypothetical protein
LSNIVIGNFLKSKLEILNKFGAHYDIVGKLLVRSSINKSKPRFKVDAVAMS